MKLFAVIMLAACETAAPPPPAKPPVKPAATVVTPRTLPDGRPACGNVMTKGPRRDCEERK